MTDGDNAWRSLIGDYEQARNREDSLDRLIEWPAELEMIGDVTGLDVLDVGCGAGGKCLELAARGARHVVGLDISDSFVGVPATASVELIPADLSELGSQKYLHGRRFDLVVFLQSIGYAADQVATLTAARRLLKPGGAVIVARSNPIRFAVERSEKFGIGLGTAYHSRQHHSYPSGWNDEITVSHATNTFSQMLNTFAEAGLRVERACEPQLSVEQQERFPHKQAWMDRYLGMIIFRAVPITAGAM